MTAPPLQEQVFPLFPKLPAEIRRAIWLQCRPHRVVELDSPHNEVVETYCELQRTSYINNSWPPVITRVCRKSREVASENAGVLGHDEEEMTETSDRPGWMAGNSTQYPWFCSTTDIIHLHWTPGYNPLYTNSGNPIPFLLWAAAKSKVMVASLNANLIHGFGEDPSYRWLRRESFELLKLWKDYLAVLMMVNLHIDVDQAARSELFGRLAEERIKLVDPADKETILRYHQLWVAGPQEDQEPAKFFELALSAEFEKQVRKWSIQVEDVWLRHKWTLTRGADFTDFGGSEQI